ncbi:hypothetical protein L873DRAFT_1194038 [Choiromyces venosus 120613-1]|uniref:Uncharacterized protein n=2 Tax=Choiromyces venosus 120613-1 TaxID=1336337 RepID=A0A3N4JJ57_9PEZI|nr:hypothetical protein L873DRAFT_1194038 [Choiromyces venosus 120613-1]
MYLYSVNHNYANTKEPPNRHTSYGMSFPDSQTVKKKSTSWPPATSHYRDQKPPRKHSGTKENHPEASQQKPSPTT